MNHPDNCVHFDRELASIYDETRPFRRQDSASPVLAEICDRLIESNPTSDSIALLEVGSGTGRITLPLAKHYERAAATRETAPALQIYCVEKSSAMLSLLQERLGDDFEHVTIDASEPRDIRDLASSDLVFDGVIAHWLFHVVSDWRVAVFAIDHVLKPDSQVFLLNEQSDLYRAIDGDYNEIEHPLVRQLWRDYHSARSKAAADLSAGSPILPPRFRLGSMVIDDRVENMFQALGWDSAQDFTSSDSWEKELRLDFIINKIIRPRAFTNMRLLPHEASAKAQYESIANNLIQGLAVGERKFPWKIITNFSGKVLARRDHSMNSTSRSVMLHVLRDTLGRRWKRRMEHAYNRETLWKRLFSSIWNRFNSLERVPTPGGALGKFAADRISGVYASVPFAVDSDGTFPFLASSCDAEHSCPYLPKIWSNLTGSMEASDPFGIRFTSRITPANPTELAVTEEGEDPGPDYIHPHVNTLDIYKDEETLLLTIANPIECTGMEGAAWNQCITLRIGELSRVVERGRHLGIVPFHDPDAQTRFLLGLAQAAQCKTTGVLYVFPFRADFHGKQAATLGMCVCAKNSLPSHDVEFLWSLNDIVFNEYLEDVLADMELHLHEDIAQLRGPAEAKITARTPAPAEKWADVNSPAVLIIVSTKTEFQTLVELAGIENSINERRKPLGSTFGHDLGFDQLPVWAINTAKAGTGTPGGALATLLSAIGELEHKPYAVFMPGIAFGLQKRKQRIGDILVSDRICVYEMQKRTPRVKIDRSVRPFATPELIRLFQSCEVNWSRETPESKRPTIDIGLVMSGEKLVDDPEFVIELLDQEPEALGGEMEAAGLYAGALENNLRWIMVKAICDWGMGKGDNHQKLAAANSIDFLFHVIDQKIMVESIRKSNSQLIPERG